MTPETRVKKKLDEHLKKMQKEHGSKMWWTKWSDRYTSGLPEYVTIIDGVVSFIEVKAKKTKRGLVFNLLRPLQRAVARKIAHAGGIYLIAVIENGELCLRKVKKEPIKK